MLGGWNEFPGGSLLRKVHVGTVTEMGFEVGGGPKNWGFEEIPGEHFWGKFLVFTEFESLFLKNS